MELEKIGSKLKLFAEVAAKKTGEAVEITKHNINIAGLEKQVDDLYKNIGEQVYSATVGGGKFDTAIMSKCQEINSLLFKIESLSMEIDSIRSSSSQASKNTVEVEFSYQNASPPIVLDPVENKAPITPQDAKDPGTSTKE